MRKSLWIDIWNDRRKEKVIQRQQQGYSFLQSCAVTNFKNTLMELAKGLGMYKGSPTSCYVVIIPPNRKEVIRIRLSDHPSTKDEWVAGEITGLPNRRYSIVIFSNKSMPLQSKQNVKETDWTNYDVEGIPVYEKCFNRIYLKDTIQTLLSILISIYEGKSPSTGSTQITNENKQYRNTNTTMKQKQTIKLNESQLRGLIKESIKKVLNEEQCIRFNWNITVSPNDAPKMYKLQRQLENAKWVMNFERDDKPCEMQHLSIYPEKAGKINEEYTDYLHYKTIEEYKEDDPEMLSDYELRNRIEYMFAYRWALRGDESVLREYVAEAKRRGLN